MVVPRAAPGIGVRVRGGEVVDVLPSVAREVECEHVVRVTDFGVHAGSPYMVMDLLAGRDLSSELRDAGRSPLPEAVDYLIQACDGLWSTHVKGIVHRDVKLANLFLATRADGERVIKVLDFGVSKAQPDPNDDASLTRTATMIGSPLYMSPEQIRDPRLVDERADVWSLGIVLYKLLTDQAPFSGLSTNAVCAAIAADPPAPIRSHAARLPPELETVVSAVPREASRAAVSQRRRARAGARTVRFGGRGGPGSAARRARVRRGSTRGRGARWTLAGLRNVPRPHGDHAAGERVERTERAARARFARRADRRVGRSDRPRLRGLGRSLAGANARALDRCALDLCFERRHRRAAGHAGPPGPLRDARFPGHLRRARFPVTSVAPVPPVTSVVPVPPVSSVVPVPPATSVTPASPHRELHRPQRKRGVPPPTPRAAPAPTSRFGGSALDVHQ